MRTWLKDRIGELTGVALCSAVAPLVPQLAGGQIKFIQIAFVVVFLIISLSIHEVAHAWVANLCGDSTAKDLGRITLNPLAHIGLFETILLPIMILVASGGRLAFGGAKPVPVSYHRLRHPLRDMMFVAIAGPLSNVAIGVLFYLGFKASVYLAGMEPPSWDYSGQQVAGDLLPTVMLISMWVNLLLAVFNMLPVPPLDGSRVMAWLLPSTLREAYVQLERFGLLIVIGVWFFVPGAKSAVLQGVLSLERLLNFITGGAW